MIALAIATGVAGLAAAALAVAWRYATRANGDLRVHIQRLMHERDAALDSLERAQRRLSGLGAETGDLNAELERRDESLRDAPHEDIRDAWENPP